MHPCLSEFPSNSFYEGTLQNEDTKSEAGANKEKESISVIFSIFQSIKHSEDIVDATKSGVMTAETGTYRWIIVCINCINFRNFIPNFRIIV